MSNFGGPNSKFEKQFTQAFSKIKPRLIKIENRMQKILFNSMQNPKRTNAYWNVVRRELDKQYKAASSIFSKWSHDEIPKRYRLSVRAIQARIESTKSIIASATTNSTGVINTQASRQLMRALWQDSASSYIEASAVGKRNMFRLTRMTQQTLINESLVEQTIASGFENFGDLRRAAEQLHGRLYTQLLTAAKNKRFVQAGAMRYRPEYYAEMVARVKFHEAHSYASLAQAKNYGTDLVIVSSHNTTTVICQEFEGKIFSISGKDKRFPVLTLSPPFHPNCLHLTFPQFESALEAQGKLDSFSAFSRGKIATPPAPASFIPVSQRAAI